MNKEYKIKLDLNKKLYNKKMAFNQFDENVNDFYIEVTKNNEVVKDLDKSIVTLVAIKPNNTVDAQFIEVKEGQIYADLKPSMCDLVGNYQAKAMIVLEGEIVTTDTINYSVNEDKIISRLNDDVASDERFTLFTDALARLSTIEISEEQRMINEAERILSEENRKIEEAKRVEAELIRQHEEADRTKYDAIRESNENIRKQNESIRLSNETNRMDEEAKRVEEENKRKLAEEERNANYNFMTEDEERRRSEANAHKEAENLRVQAETNRVNEEAKRRTTEQARVSAENTRVSNENTREANEITRKSNETKRVEAETQRQNRYNSFITEAEANANNFENYTNNAKAKEEERKANELDRKSQEDKRVSNEVERISNENTRKANEESREINEASRQDIFENKVDEIDEKISEINTTKDNFVSSINTKVDNKISEIEVAKSDMTTTVSNKVNEVETRFNTLTSKQQQDAEVIDARDGETSLKARLDRDIEKANKELDKIKKLEESTVSTVETESDFTTVEATNGGYFEDVKLEGKTLVNLCTQKEDILVNATKRIGMLENVKENTTYTIVVTSSVSASNIEFSIRNGEGNNFIAPKTIFNLSLGVNVLTLTTINDFSSYVGQSFYVAKRGVDECTVSNIILLEGDHTQNPPSFFEGLKSVSQSASEDGIDEILVSSVKGDGNLFEILEDIQSNSKGLDIKFDKAKQEIKVNGTCTDDLYFYAKSTNIDRFDIKARNCVCSLSIDICEGTATIGDSNEIMYIEVPNNLTGKAINLRVSDKFAKIENVSLGNDFSKSWIRFKKNAKFDNCTIRIMLNKGTALKPYTLHQSDKKRLLYYNEETQAWEKPILREWDSIEKHADGKYYYHQRSGEVVLNGTHAVSTYGTESDTHITFNTYISSLPSGIPHGTLICNRFKCANVLNNDDCIWMLTDKNIYIRIAKSKLSTQDVAGFNQWLQANNVTVVYQLAQEKVYECTNIDLITYANETNYIVECGAIVPRTTLKVHNNISNVVSLLQKKVSLLESNITSYMITQNRLMLASRYNADTVSFKVDVATLRNSFEYDNDLYELILNNILVGKDNYNREYIENLIIFYWMDFVISDEMYSTLFEIIEEQHNPKIEEETPLI